MQKSPVRPKQSEEGPHAEEVEDVDGMDVTVRADASDSEDVVVESQEVQGEAVEASRADQEEDVETQVPRSSKALTCRANARSTSTTWCTARIGRGAKPACEDRPKMIVI